MEIPEQVWGVSYRSRKGGRRLKLFASLDKANEFYGECVEANPQFHIWKKVA